MTDVTEAFYDRLRMLGRVAMLARVTGSLRVEIIDGRKTSRTQIWVRRGEVSIGAPSGAADCTMVAPRHVWEALVTGEFQPMPTFLRGALQATGDPAMLVLMRRLFAVAAVPEQELARPSSGSRAVAATRPPRKATSTVKAGTAAPRTVRKAGTATKAATAGGKRAATEPAGAASATRKRAGSQRAGTAQTATSRRGRA